jgi:Amt family ammonium transporter
MMTIYIFMYSLANEPNNQAVMACVITNLSGSVGAVTWSVIDYITKRKCSAVSFCLGSVAGLIAVTPSAGCINPVYGVVFGMASSILCRIGHKMKKHFQLDDALDVFALHGTAGFVGIMLNVNKVLIKRRCILRKILFNFSKLPQGIFAQKYYGGNLIPRGGVLDGNWIQMWIQISDMVVGFVWSFFVSFVALYLMNKTRCLKLRLETRAELSGPDESELGMSCYLHIEEMKFDQYQTTPGPLSEISSKTNARSFNFEVINVKPSQHGNEIEEKNGEIPTVTKIAEATGIDKRRSSWRSYWNT